VKGKLGCLSKAFALDLEVEGEGAEDEFDFEARVDVVSEDAKSYIDEVWLEVTFRVEVLDVGFEELVVVSLEVGLE